MQYVIDNTSRLSLILSAYDADFQIPNNPGQTPAFAVAGVPLVPGSITADQPLGVSQFSSAHLDENQNEQNEFAVLAYQKSAGNLNFQQSIFIRNSSILFTPDSVGDLVFNGVSSRDDRYTLTGGAELDASYQLTATNTLRGGYVALFQHASNRTVTGVFPDRRQRRTTFGHARNSEAQPGQDGGNLRFLSPGRVARLQAVDDQLRRALRPRGRVRARGAGEPAHQRGAPAFDDTILHAGYSRYFTPRRSKGAGSGHHRTENTTNAAAITQNSPDKSERANYLDAGVTQTLFKTLQLGIDGYYKRAVNQIDEGQFGTAIIESPFNYRYGEIYGVEGTLTYVNGGFETYANVAYSSAHGEKIDSSEFLFGRGRARLYPDSHPVYLDHDQTSTVSAGACLRLDRRFRARAISADMLYGSGLRNGFANTEQVARVLHLQSRHSSRTCVSPATSCPGESPLRCGEPARSRVRVA